MGVAEASRRVSRKRILYPLSFFSSSRRHTTFACDWSSDVFSSDLTLLAGEATPRFDPDQCSRCDATSKSVAPFHPDDPEALPEDRGKRLCPSCWIGALQRRAAGQTRETTCTEPGCDKTVGEHIEEFRRYGEGITARNLARTTPWGTRRRGGGDDEQPA